MRSSANRGKRGPQFYLEGDGGRILGLVRNYGGTGFQPVKNTAKMAVPHVTDTKIRTVPHFIP